MANSKLAAVIAEARSRRFPAKQCQQASPDYASEALRCLLYAVVFTAVSIQNALALQICSGDRQSWDNCVGEVRFPSGDRYLGRFKSGKFHGIGIYEKKGGGSYIGEWQGNTPHGVGRSSSADGGEPVEGRWVNGRVVNKEVVNIPAILAEIEFFHRSALAKKRDSDELAIGNRIDATNRATENVSDQRIHLPTSIKESQATTQTSTINSNSPRLALLIGNANYKVSPLRNPTNDVREMHKVLERVGFTVYIYENIDLGSMRKVIREFGERITKEHIGLFYFSGHGIQVDGKNYLLPVDIDIRHEDEVASSAVEVGFLLSKLEAANNTLNMVILDACRDSPLPRRSRSGARGLNNISAASGTLIAFSTSPGRVAFDGEGVNSPYTKYLVNAISQQGLLLEQVFKSVRANVIRETRGQQVPWENSSIVGDFYFLK